MIKISEPKVGRVTRTGTYCTEDGVESGTVEHYPNPDEDALRTRQAAQVLAGLVQLGFSLDEISRGIDRAERLYGDPGPVGFGACETPDYPALGAEEHIESGWR